MRDIVEEYALDVASVYTAIRSIVVVHGVLLPDGVRRVEVGY